MTEEMTWQEIVEAYKGLLDKQSKTIDLQTDILTKHDEMDHLRGLNRPPLCPSEEGCKFVFQQPYKNGGLCYGFMDKPEEVTRIDEKGEYPGCDNILHCNFKVVDGEILEWRATAMTPTEALASAAGLGRCVRAFMLLRDWGHSG